MFNLKNELMNLEYREVEINLKDIFPNLDLEKIKDKFGSLINKNPHETVFNVCKDLWNGGYDSVLREHEFFDKAYSNFTGHCHQCTPILGLVLKALGFEEVSYLECFRIYESFLRNGIIEQFPPEEEPNPDNLKEFCSIKRIPYCCLEVFIDGKPYYVTGKHIKPHKDNAFALLTSSCYIDFIGVFKHQENNSKSGIYLKNVIPPNNPCNIDFTRRIVWMKQTVRDPGPEYFATFLRMKLK